jgi:hypothetical protein
MNDFPDKSKGSKKCAEMVGKVRKENYLAHSIREIEHYLLQKYSIHYHIITFQSYAVSKSKIFFWNTCCEIRLPKEDKNIDDKKIRLKLAHELGHLVYNIDNLNNPEFLENTRPTDAEEIFSWEFAFHLIHEKSVEYETSVLRKKFIYKDHELKASIAGLLTSAKPSVSAAVKKSLKIRY